MKISPRDTKASARSFHQIFMSLLVSTVATKLQKGGHFSPTHSFSYRFLINSWSNYLVNGPGLVSCKWSLWAYDCTIHIMSRESFKFTQRVKFQPYCGQNHFVELLCEHRNKNCFPLSLNSDLCLMILSYMGLVWTFCSIIWKVSGTFLTQNTKNHQICVSQRPKKFWLLRSFSCIRKVSRTFLDQNRKITVGVRTSKRAWPKTSSYNRLQKWM